MIKLLHNKTCKKNSNYYCCYINKNEFH